MRLAYLAAAGLAAAAALSSIPAASAQTADGAIAARRGFFSLLDINLATLDAMAKGNVPFDAAKAAAAAANLQTVAAYPVTELFVAGTSLNEKKGATRARPEIWVNLADFNTKLVALREALPVMAAAAPNGPAAIGAAMQTVGGACVACHRPYRARDF